MKFAVLFFVVTLALIASVAAARRNEDNDGVGAELTEIEDGGNYRSKRGNFFSRCKPNLRDR